jgi:hypothetical protein
METRPPRRRTSRHLVERAAEAGLGSVPVFGNALAVTFVTAIGWQLEERREKWFTELAEGVEALRKRVGDLDLETLADNDLFVDAVVTATMTAQHAHQAEKIEALRNAVLNRPFRPVPPAPGNAVG